MSDWLKRELSRHLEPAQAPQLPFPVEATVHHKPVDEGIQASLPAETTQARKQLQEGVLGDIHGIGRVAGKAERDRIHPVFMDFKQRAESVAVPPLTCSNQFPLRPFQHHPRKFSLLDEFQKDFFGISTLRREPAVP